MIFDEYSQNYNAVLNRGLSLSGETVDHFAQKRCEYTYNHVRSLGVNVQSIAEFGCGTGNNLFYLRKYFPKSHVLGFDISDESIKRANERFFDDPHVDIKNLLEFQPREHCADLVFVNGVFHHIPVDAHVENLELIQSMLKKNALLILFENNYFSLATRWIMNRVAFDKDAVLINPYRLSARIRQMHFRNTHVKFYFIFPKILSGLRFLEPFCEKIPLGAQYCVFAQKS